MKRALSESTEYTLGTFVQCIKISYNYKAVDVTQDGEFGVGILWGSVPIGTWKSCSRCYKCLIGIRFWQLDGKTKVRQLSTKVFVQENV